MSRVNISLTRLLVWLALSALALVLPSSARAAGGRIGDLTTHPGDVPRRLVGYGLVVGLDGTGDRSFGGATGSAPSVRSVVNLLRRFGVEVPSTQMRLRNVAAVLVTAEVSPYLRAGGRFDVQVSALGDARSLRGGVLWMTPLLPGAGEDPIATAQGALASAVDDQASRLASLSNTARLPDGGLLEVDPAGVGAAEARLLLNAPDLGAAARIAAAINATFGDGAAKVSDPGSIALTPPAANAADLNTFLAAVDTVSVTFAGPARVVISARDGTLAAGGDLRVGRAVVRHGALTLEIGSAQASDPTNGRVRFGADAAVSEVAAALHAAGADSRETVAIFEALRAAGALRAEVVVR